MADREKRERKMKKKKKVFGPGALIGLIFFLVGLGQLVAGISVTVAGYNRLSGKEKIVGMVSENTGDDIYVAYRYMGRDYEDRLSFYSDLLREGDDIDLYIDPENPGQAECKMSVGLPGGIFIFLGVIFALMGGSFLFAGKLGGRKNRKLKETGRKVYAEVTGGRVCYNYTVNGRHPFKLECKYEDTATFNTYLYSSGYTWDDPEVYVGQQVAVYIDQNDMGKYYVDLDSLAEPVLPDGNVIHDFR